MKRVVITGAASGIGASTAIYLSKVGYSCVVIDRDKQMLEHTFSLLETETGISHKLIVADLTELKKIGEIFSSIDDGTPLFGFIHCAGLSPLMMIENNDIDLMINTYKVNVFSFIELTKFFLRRVDPEIGGSIVAITSIASESATYQQCIYGSSKAALNGTLKHIAKTGLEKKVRTNAISPSVVDTPMLRSVYDGRYEELTMRNAPLGVVDTLQIAEMIEYLLSDKADKITGSVIKIESGAGL